MTWEEKRQIILKRDNYSCKLCKTFNPRLGPVWIPSYDGTGFEEHRYDYWASTNEYSLHAEYNGGLSIDFNFGVSNLVMPVMQVHHTLYIQGRENWNYDGEDLITLCKDCHTTGHRNYKVPVYSESGILINYIFPENIIEDNDEMFNFKPWTFIHYNSTTQQWETAKTFTPTSMTHMVIAGDFIEANELANKMWQIFVARFLPQYRIFDPHNNNILGTADVTNDFISGWTIVLLP